MGRVKFDDTDLQNQANAYALDPARNARTIDTGVSETGGRLLPGTVSPDFGGSQYGDLSGYSAYDNDVERDRSMGAASNDRASPQLDQTQANESRGLQMGALGLLQGQADGSAASSAQIMAQRANQNAAQQTAAAVMSSKGGPGSNIASFNGAAPMAAQQAMAANAANANARAAEISRGQSQYASGAQHVEGQDVQAATANAQLEAQQRALNEARQQGFERRGWNVRNMESSAEDRYKRNTDAALNLNESNNLAQQQRDSAHAQQTTGMIMSAISGAATAASDERMKRNIHPMGSLARFARGEE